jgi:hypothetical protein
VVLGQAVAGAGPARERERLDRLHRIHRGHDDAGPRRTARFLIDVRYATTDDALVVFRASMVEPPLCK